MAAKKEDTGGADAFEFATNPVKLARSQAYVAAAQPALKHGSKEHVAAVKEHYVSIKGSLSGTAKAAGAKKGGKVVNLAEDDGSEDIENDEE